MATDAGNGMMTIAGPQHAWGMTFGQFALLYVSKTTADSSLVSRQLEMAFSFFDEHGRASRKGPGALSGARSSSSCRPCLFEG